MITPIGKILGHHGETEGPKHFPLNFTPSLNYINKSLTEIENKKGDEKLQSIY